MWVLVATMVAIFLIGLAGGLGAFGAGMLGLAVVALIGPASGTPRNPLTDSR